MLISINQLSPADQIDSMILFARMACRLINASNGLVKYHLWVEDPRKLQRKTIEPDVICAIQAQYRIGYGHPWYITSIAVRKSVLLTCQEPDDYSKVIMTEVAKKRDEMIENLVAKEKRRW